MALESVTYLNDLVKTNPVASDGRHQGDDHLRNIKTALLAGLNGILGARKGLAIASTIATGNVTPAADTGNIFALAGEGGVADALDTITHTNLYDGALIFVKSGTASYNITLTHGVGSGDELIHVDSADIVLSNTYQWVLYFVDKTNSKNIEIIRSHNLKDDFTVNDLTINELARLVQQAAVAGSVAASSVAVFATATDSVTSSTGTAGVVMQDENDKILNGIIGGVCTLPDGNSTLTYGSGEIYYITPTAARTITLPTTSVGKGYRVEIFNAGASDGVDLLVSVAASGGAIIRTIPPGHSAWFRANQDTPTTSAHWEFEKGLIYVDEDSAASGANVSMTLPAYAVRAAGSGIRVNIAASWNAGQLIVKLNAQTVYPGLSVTSGAQDYIVRVILRYRTSTTAIADSFAYLATAGADVDVRAVSSLDFTAAQTLQVTNSGTGTIDGWSVELF